MIVVITAPRSTDYLGATLAAIDAQRPPDHPCVVVSDGAEVTGGAPAGWATAVYETDHRPGNAAAFWFAMQLAVAGGDDLLFFEDDVELTRSTVPYMAAFPVPSDLAFVTFMSAQTSEVAGWGMYRAPAMTFGLNQALKIPARSLAQILAAHPAPRGPHADTELARAVDAIGGRYGIHCPDLVRHVGEVSVANPGAPLDRQRVGRTWKGADFDPVAQLRSANELGLYR